MGITSATKFQNKPSEFEYNKIYTLYNINKNADDKWCYTFKTSGAPDAVMCFDSMTQADTWIASCLGEKIPDYDAVHRRKTT